MPILTVWPTSPEFSQFGGTWTAAITRSAPTRNNALLAAMRLPAATHGELIDSLVPHHDRTRHCHRPSPPGRRIPSPIRLGQPRPAWVTLLREDGSLERFPGAGRLRRPASSAHRPASPIERGPARTFCHLTVAPGRLLPAADLLAGERRFGIAAHLYAAAIARRSGHRRLYHAAPASPPKPPTRCRRGRPESAARPVPARPQPSQPVSTIGPALPGPDLYRRLRLPRRRRLPSPPGPVDYPAVWERNAPMLHAAFNATDQDQRSPRRCAVSRFSKRSLRF